MRGTLLGWALAGSLLAGCAVPAGVAYNPNPPAPAVRAEAIPLPPVSEEPLIWRPGHWDWTGAGYDWVQGRWVTRAGHGTAWQDGYWRQGSAGWVWLPAHWM